jgi:hypothetical protein
MHAELFAPEEFLGDAVELLRTAPADERGAIFTRTEVVDFMLDLVGYTSDADLTQRRLLEPSFGGGEFLLRAVDRLLAAARRTRTPYASLVDAIRGVELHRTTFEQTQQSLSTRLQNEGLASDEAKLLLDRWLTNTDFLLQDFEEPFDYVVGNPPYVRQELIPDSLLATYRQRYSTLYDRADLYVPFMERSLELLKDGGMMTFICSDRWMKNRYGGPLRALISRGYSLRYYVDMVGTDAFQSEVTAYPAITVFQRGASSSQPLLAHRPAVTQEALQQLHGLLTGPPTNYNGTVIPLAKRPQNDEPWLLESDAQPSMDLVRRLESAFPTLEEVGCTVGIGVASGADKIFIGPMDELDVEDSRKLPLAMTKDILTGEVIWRGLGIVNPFEEDGSLANFHRYPRFARFMTQHQELLMKRHCAQKGNGTWYRTIDRITPSLTLRPKLLVPDIKGDASLVLEDGRLYPHHNLYYIVSDEWPLPALQRVLSAGIAKLFVRTYSTKMRGGSLRFQAQYLRRIRLPRWSTLSPELQSALNAEINDELICSLFGLNPADLVHLKD